MEISLATFGKDAFYNWFLRVTARLWFTNALVSIPGQFWAVWVTKIAKLRLKKSELDLRVNPAGTGPLTLCGPVFHGRQNTE